LQQPDKNLVRFFAQHSNNIMSLQFVSSPNAPAAIGPYSQAVKHGNTVYVSGVIALDPATMTLVGATVGEQAEQIFKNMRAVLDAAGSSMDKVLKTTVLLRDMADFEAVNKIYAQHFGDHRPARATYAVAGLPKNALIEIECIAAV
jgi:reactive intermediate/imine deaminase